MKATPPIIPPSVEGFAKAVAALAEAQGIEKFDMTVKPNFGEDYASERSLIGDIKILYWMKDGRGRPSRNIRVIYETRLEQVVEYTPESFS